MWPPRLWEKVLISSQTVSRIEEPARQRGEDADGRDSKDDKDLKDEKLCARGRPSRSHRRAVADRQGDEEAGVAGARFQPQLAAMPAHHDAAGDVEAQP